MGAMKEIKLDDIIELFVTRCLIYLKTETSHSEEVILGLNYEN